jgi:glycerophosphoryl diester phosphodiesterase
MIQLRGVFADRWPDYADRVRRRSGTVGYLVLGVAVPAILLSGHQAAGSPVWHAAGTATEPVAPAAAVAALPDTARARLAPADQADTSTSTETSTSAPTRRQRDTRAARADTGAATTGTAMDNGTATGTGGAAAPGTPTGTGTPTGSLALKPESGRSPTVRTNRRGPVVLAHRGGVEKAPENSMAAFDDAIALGTEYLETDVRHSADGVAFLVHDPTLPAQCTLYPHLPVTALTAAQLTEVRCGGEPLVRLRELVTRLRRPDAARTSLMAEVKDTDPLGVRDALAPLGWRRVVVQSFNLPALRMIEKSSPQVRTCALMWQSSTLPQALTVTHDCVAVDYHDLDQGFVRRAHTVGAVVYPFTVDDADAMRRVTALGVDGIITNRPRTAFAAARR